MDSRGPYPATTTEPTEIPVSPALDPTDVRDAYFQEVYRAALADRGVIILTNDQGALSLERLKSERPDQYINVGIAEQNAIDVAAGLAIGGMRPIVYGITNFVSLRCAEQISVNLGTRRLPVTIVASGGGLTYSTDGPTHHATQDIAVLRSVPGMTIYNPGDAASTAAAARMSLASDGPSYVRLEKGVHPKLYDASSGFGAGFGRFGRDDGIVILSTGFAIHIASAVARELNGRGIRAGMIDLYRLKPVDTQSLGLALRNAERIAVIEEQTPIGGVFSIAAETLADCGLFKRVRRYSLPDAPCFHYGSRDWLHEQMSLSAQHVTRDLEQWLAITR